MREFTTTNGQKLARVSRWIKIRTAYNITEKHSLSYYADKIDDEENSLDYFIYHGKKYAINQFYRFGTMFSPGSIPMFYENDKLLFISGYDSENYYNPIMIEISDCCEYVRIYEEI